MIRAPGHGVISQARQLGPGVPTQLPCGASGMIYLGIGAASQGIVAGIAFAELQAFAHRAGTSTPQSLGCDCPEMYLFCLSWADHYHLVVTGSDSVGKSLWWCMPGISAQEEAKAGGLQVHVLSWMVVSQNKKGLGK